MKPSEKRKLKQKLAVLNKDKREIQKLLFKFQASPFLREKLQTKMQLVQQQINEVQQSL